MYISHKSIHVYSFFCTCTVCRYRGGLDNCNDQTGEYSIYTEYKDQEIMFHVSTLLPYDSGDRQQVTTPLNYVR